MSQQPRRVLMVAYHFPPVAGSSGIQRTLRLVQHLPALGWQPLVLTASVRAYERTSPDLEGDVPNGTVVRRAFALDSARHLALLGRYPKALARPDRWMTWRFDAVRHGLTMVRQLRPQAIWSTYPIATAHVIGAELQRRTGLPWIADFRDPMAQDGYPEDPVTWRHFERIERRAVLAAACSTFTTPSAAADYRERYPQAAGRIHLLENGYDDPSFAGVCGDEAPLVPGAVTLVHSGVIYPSERDPTQLMIALRRLHEAGRITPERLRLRFRAPVSVELLESLAVKHDVGAYIELLPPVPYRVALKEMQAADGLLVMQASNCNAQIPAKVYEYIRAGRPTLGLTDLAGDTADVLRRAGFTHLAPLESADAIAQILERFLADLAAGRAPLARDEVVRSSSRHARSEAFAQLLESVIQ